MLTYKQFLLMELLLTSPKKYAQREIAQLLSLSLGSINKLISELNGLHYLEGTDITESGTEVMEHYRVTRAVFFAAGFGSRMVPITLNTPKPLVRVHGKRLIDGLLDALIAADIQEIYLVRGYLGEQFDQLLSKYPMIRFIENPLYNESNNISSAYMARGLFENSYILEADLWLQNPALIKKYQYRTNYLSIPAAITDDWCFFASRDVIESISIGGENCYKWVGISYWTPEDAKKLSLDLEKAFHAPGGKERYWDQVPLVIFKNDYTIYLRQCSDSDVVEIDSYRELVALDSSYQVP